MLPQGFAPRRFGASLELCEDLLDGVEVRTGGRQEEQPGAGGADEFADGLTLVAAQIVQDDASDRKWQFKAKFRANAYGCRGSRVAIGRLKKLPPRSRP